MLKKVIGIFLAVLLIAAIPMISAHAEETLPSTEPATGDVTEAATEAVPEPSTEAVIAPADGANVIYFDPEGSGWKDYEAIGFHIWEIDDDAFTDYSWGSRQQVGKQAPDGRWYYDLDAAKLKIRKGKQYGVIFYAIENAVPTSQTYNLIFGSDCIGKTAACEGTIYENPENSHKTTQAAFWEKGVDPKVYGPELQISSIGTVVGVCCPASTTPLDMFVDFLHNTLQNARIYAGKSDQQLIDDIGAALGLKRDEVEEAIIETGLDIDWDFDKSHLPYEAKEVEETEQPTEVSDDNVPKSPNTGGDAALYILIVLAAAAAGLFLSVKKLRNE